MSAIFYLLSPLTMHPLNLLREDEEEAYRTWLCPGCGSPTPRTGAVHIRIASRSMGVGPVNLVFGCDIGVVRKDFLAALGKEVVSRDLHLGVVRDARGRALSEWATVRGRHRVQPRGSKGVKHRVCERCGRNMYFALDYHYLCPAPPRDADVFTAGTRLVVTPRIYDRLRGQPWRKLGVDKLAVKETAPDGLGPLMQP